MDTYLREKREEKHRIKLNNL